MSAAEKPNAGTRDNRDPRDSRDRAAPVVAEVPAVSAVSSTAVPRLRFKGFEGEWKKLPLSAISDKVLEKNLTNQISEVFTNSAEHGVISQRDYFDFDVAKNTAGYYVVRENDFVYNPRISTTAPVGPIRRNALGRAGVMSPLYFVFRTHSVDYNYLDVYFKTACWHPFMLFNGDSGARSDRFSIKSEVFMTMPIACPASPSEQSRIASFFSRLDAAIAGAKARVGKLRRVKKAMLVKMFPREGATVPEIRFKGFAGEWEKKALSDIAEKVLEKNVARQFSEVFTNSAEFGVMSQRDYFDFDVAKNTAGYYVVREDDFVYNPRISTIAPVGPINRNALGRVGVMSPLYFVFRTNGIDVEYLSVYFKTRCWHPFMYFNGDSGARSDRFSIKNEVFMTMPILVPRDVAEQRKIGAFFNNLDRLIAAAEKRVGKLKQVKAALLEGMFA